MKDRLKEIKDRLANEVLANEKGYTSFEFDSYVRRELDKLLKVVEVYEKVLKDECYCIESWNGVETCGLCEGVQKAKEIMGGSDD